MTAEPQSPPTMLGAEVPAEGMQLPAALAVALDHVHLHYGTFPAVQDVSFSVPEGQFVAIVGPTGCGKSSVLNLVAGILEPSGGQVLVADKPVDGVSRHCAYMFQSDALLPWKAARDNVMLGPILNGMARSDASALADDWLERVGLRGFEDRYSHQLSGGQRKRVAIAQALINRRPIVLMDEPFGSLDAQTRVQMEQELLTLWDDLKATVLFVTHDLEEAIALSDRVILFTAGPRATIKGDYPVPLPRPRNVLEARFIPGFNEIYERVWNDLREEVTATYERRDQHHET